MKGIMLRFGALLKKAAEGWKSLDASLKILMCCGIIFDVALVMVVGGLFGWFAGTLWPGLWIGLILLGVELVVSVIVLTAESAGLALAIVIALIVLPIYAIAMPIMLLSETESCWGRLKKNSNWGF